VRRRADQEPDGRSANILYSKGTEKRTTENGACAGLKKTWKVRPELRGERKDSRKRIKRKQYRGQEGQGTSEPGGNWGGSGKL